jgi:predicted RNA-binding Zn ribbon-like protein
MTQAPIERPEPFLVGDHLAMDFLNSATPDGTEWLRDGADLLAWLEAAGAIDASVASGFRQSDKAVLDPVAGRARELREWFRAMLHDLQEGRAEAVEQKDLAPLNDVILEDDSYGQLVIEPADGETGHRHLWLRRERKWRKPDALLQPLAAAIVDLLSQQDLALVRNCEGPICSLMFLDRTKSHARRWCSMAVCGNRAKAAAHRAKRRKSA